MDGEEKKEKADFTARLRSNPWILSTFVLVILAIVLLAGSLGNFSFTGNAVSADEAGNILLNAYPGISIDSVKEVSGIYQVNVLYNGQIIPLYVTKDGKYFGQMSLFDSSASGSNSASGSSTTGTGSVADMSVFSDSSLYPSLGPSNAKTTVIEFSDFQCPYCAMASGLPSWISQYESQYGDLMGVAQKIQQQAQQGKLKFIYVSMSFLGQESVYAAQAGLCANEQGKFWQLHDAIFTAQTQGENTGKYSKTNLEKIAGGISGLDQNKFKSCLENDETLSSVQEISLAASGAGVSGTPMFFVNGQQVSASWAAIQAAL